MLAGYQFDNGRFEIELESGQVVTGQVFDSGRIDLDPAPFVSLHPPPPPPIHYEIQIRTVSEGDETFASWCLALSVVGFIVACIVLGLNKNDHNWAWIILPAGAMIYALLNCFLLYFSQPAFPLHIRLYDCDWRCPLEAGCCSPNFKAFYLLTGIKLLFLAFLSGLVLLLVHYWWHAI